MRLKYVILYVANVRESLEFYEQAFGLQRRFLHESGDYGEIDTGSTLLAFSSTELIRKLGKSPAAPEATKPTFEIAFETEDVQAALERAVGAGATLMEEAREQPWGQTTAYVSDGNGFLVEICTPVAAPP